MKNIINEINKIYCLTLDKRIDLAVSLQEDGKRYGLDIELYIAGDGSKNLKYNFIDKKEKPPLLQYSQYDWPLWFESHSMYNAWWCHRNMIEKAYNAGCDNVMLLEDDACFSSDFINITEKVSDFFIHNDWDLIFFGNHNTNYPTVFIADYIATSAHCAGFHGVLMSRKIMKIAKNFPPYGTMDWMFQQFHDIYRSYRILPSIINQKKGWSYAANCILEAERV